MVKVEIRKTTLADAEGIHKVLNHKRVLKELSEDYTLPLPITKVRKDIRNGIKEWDRGQAYVFTILADGAIAGQIMLEDPDERKKRYTVGFFIGIDFWNKGVATKALKEIVKFGFKTLKLHKIIGDYDGCNPGSGRVMEKAGFKKEATFKRHAFRQGRWQDVIHYGIFGK